MRPKSEIRLPMTMTSRFDNMKSSSKFFDTDVFFLPSLVTGPRFMSVSLLVLVLGQFSFIRDWAEIQIDQNTSVWVLPDIWGLGRVRDTKVGTNVNKKLLNAAKCQGYSFYGFWVINGKPTGGKNILPTYNHFHNILRLSDDVLPTFLFTTSEAMRNYELLHELPNDLTFRILGN